jgi:hypothetical protein
VARGKGRILLEAWVIPDLRFFALRPLASRVIHPKFGSKHTWHICSGIFAKKWNHFGGGGMPPAVAPEGDLVFRGKPSRPLTLLIDEIYICTTNWGVRYINNEKDLEILSKGRSDVWWSKK